MLEGAATKSDTATKVNLIDIALTKAMISVGDIPPGPQPTDGYQRIMSPVERKKTSIARTLLQRKYSESAHADALLEQLLHAEVKQLEYAKVIAIQHRQLVSYRKSVHFIFLFI